METLLKLTLAAALAGLCLANEDEPLSIGSRRELFIDRLLVDEMNGVELRLHHPVKAPRPKSPLPERHYITIIKDGDLYRAYWRGSDAAETSEHKETVEYGESTNGHEWSFPVLGLHEVNGSRENNVILARMPNLLHNFCPFLDTRPGVPETERFKAVAGYPGQGDKRGKARPGIGLFAFHSADGIHWEKLDEIIPYRDEWRHAFDSQNVAFWSEAEGQYVCYFRTWTEDKLRSVSRTISKDFKRWTDPVAMDPNLPGEHLYTSQTHPYCRAPHIYIALPTRYVPGRGDPTASADHNNATDILFMSTRAGSERYDRLFTEAFIRPGLEKTRWLNRANYVALNVVPTSPTELSIYHRSGDRFVLRPDGFVSFHAGAGEGELLTRPLTFSGDQLRVNLSTSAAGSLQVELQTEAGEPIPGLSLDDCQPVIGDDLDLAVSWPDGANHLTAWSGKPVRLRFVMKECDLFSFQFSKKP